MTKNMFRKPWLYIVLVFLLTILLLANPNFIAGAAPATEISPSGLTDVRYVQRQSPVLQQPGMPIELQLTRSHYSLHGPGGSVTENTYEGAVSIDMWSPVNQPKDGDPHNDVLYARLVPTGGALAFHPENGATPLAEEWICLCWVETFDVESTQNSLPLMTTQYDQYDSPNAGTIHTILRTVWEPTMAGDTVSWEKTYSSVIIDNPKRAPKD